MKQPLSGLVLAQHEHGSWENQSSGQIPRAFPWPIRVKVLWLPGPLVERCLQLCFAVDSLKEMQKRFLLVLHWALQKDIYLQYQFKWEHKITRKQAYTTETVLTGTLQLNLRGGFQSGYSCCLVYFSIPAQSEAEVHRAAENWDLDYN